METSRMRDITDPGFMKAFEKRQLAFPAEIAEGGLDTRFNQDG